MSATAALWVIIGAMLTLASFRRPVYAVCLYMLTFFAAPHLWWWGKDLPSARYALLAGFLLLGAVMLYSARTPKEEVHRFRFTGMHLAGFGMALNATFVHFVIASDPSVSVNNYI
jgi:putative inorganic carbon (hco3(-)) transporter